MRIASGAGEWIADGGCGVRGRGRVGVNVGCGVRAVPLGRAGLKISFPIKILIR